MRPQTGELINGKYRLMRLIGDGGMGTVFEARHEYLGTTVALKFLHAELAQKPGLVARFLREARLSANIKSPHIAHVTDVDQANDGVAYIVMELLEGQSLMKILDQERKLPTDKALDYTVQMLSGLEAAHAVGVVHRDLKPDNVFVVTTPQGPLVKLLDFGIAKLRTSKEFQVGLTRPGVMMGTPEYMAPEQAFAADSVDARADIYSIGAMLYEMLAGTRPGHGEDAQQIAAFIISGKVARLNRVNTSIPEALADIVHRAMAPSPADRFPSATALRDALLPHCRSLSFAGRLAATPPPAEAAPGGVAPTWPPDAPPPPKTQPDGGTEARPQPPPATAAAPWPPMQTPPPAASAYVPPTYNRPSDVHVAPTRTRGPRRLSIWLLVLMVGAAVAIVAAAMTMSETTPTPADRPPLVTTQPPSPPPPASTTAVRATPTSNIAPPVQPPKETPSVATHPAVKTQRDASADDAQAKVGTPGIPGLPFPFPTGFPIPSAFPMPSAFPLPLPVPSGFPPFQLPGFPQPAPAGSQ